MIWLVATFIYLSIGITLTANIIKKLFNIMYYKRIIPAISIIVLSSSLLLSSYIDILKCRGIMSVYIAPVILFLYPFLILISAKIKEKIRRKNEVS